MAKQDYYWLLHLPNNDIFCLKMELNVYMSALVYVHMND